MVTSDQVFTARGTPNIALIKYWGKRDEKLILPQNSSISLTCSGDCTAVMGKTFKLYTTTSVVFSDKVKEDSFYINGVKQDLKTKDKLERFGVMDILRPMAKTKKKALVVSDNSFPTASGLASSASGIATLIYAASSALGLKLSEKEMSIVARRGSGSASRSMYGGIVMWRKGEKSDGSDSYAEQLYPADYWPELIDIVVITSSAKKKVSSRAGMAQTVATSPLYKRRLETVESRIKILIEAIDQKDIGKLAEVTMIDSNNMHATMADTMPPIHYLNDISKEIIYQLHDLNKSEGKTICGYTFDAGPNPQIITIDKYKDRVISALRGIDGVESIFYTKVGKGPQLLDRKSSLIDPKTLEPIIKG